MIRPKVIIHSLASVDGRLTLSPDTLLLYGDERWNAVAGDSEDTYIRLQAEYHPQAFLEGSGSFCLPGQTGDPLLPAAGDSTHLYRDFLPEAVVNGDPKRRWLTVVDSRGRVRWMYKEYPGESWVGWHLLVLVSHGTPAEYLAYLQSETIPYLVTGDRNVDLARALEKLAGIGVDCLICTGGGHLAGALLRQGLLDEISVEFFPAIIGGTHTSSLFAAPDLKRDEMPVRLELRACQALSNGHVRLNYRVLRE